MNTIVGAFQAEQVGIYKRIDVLGGDFTTSVASGSYKLTAAEEIHLVVGAASLVMKKDGTITLNGKTIDIVGTRAHRARFQTH